MGTQVLYFTATWCGPCRTFGPLLERLSAEFGFAIVKLDVEEHADMVAEYGVQSIPTTVWIDEGEVRSVLLGAKTEQQLRSTISALR